MDYSEQLRDYYRRFGIVGEMLLKSDLVSEADLLRVIPNNYKRLHGMPLLRLNGKRKAKLKKQHANRLMVGLFPIVTALMEQEISKQVPDLFSSFAEVRCV